MVARKKSRFERWLSWNQHRKRLGAKHVAQQLHSVDFETLKQQIIEGAQPEYTHGASKNLAEHSQQLRAEFAGQSELLYYHAQLIVLIRREFEVAANYARFEALWQHEGAYLLNELNTRWLVSAADTFADYASDPTARSLALSASLLINTIKIQETERYLHATEQTPINAQRLQTLQQGRVALFDGTSAFAVGTDDTLRNLRWRIDAISQLHPVGALVAELFQRLQQHDSVYQRLRLQHSRAKTSWW